MRKYNQEIADLQQQIETLKREYAQETMKMANDKYVPGSLFSNKDKTRFIKVLRTYYKEALTATLVDGLVICSNFNEVRIYQDCLLHEDFEYQIPITPEEFEQMRSTIIKEITAVSLTTHEQTTT